MDREESRALYYSGRSGILRPVELVRAAWKDQGFRENVVFDMAKSVSKEGNFSLVWWLQTLTGVLDAEEACDLYIRIRDQSRMFEVLWRDEFISAFPNCSSLLPAITHEKLQQGFSYGLVFSIEHHQPERLAQELAAMRKYSFPSVQLLRVLPDTIKHDELGITCTSSNDPNGITIFELARRIGTPEIIRILNEATAWSMQSE